MRFLPPGITLRLAGQWPDAAGPLASPIGWPGDLLADPQYSDRARACVVVAHQPRTPQLLQVMADAGGAGQARPLSDVAVAGRAATLSRVLFDDLDYRALALGEHLVRTGPTGRSRAACHQAFTSAVADLQHGEAFGFLGPDGAGKSSMTKRSCLLAGASTVSGSGACTRCDTKAAPVRLFCRAIVQP
jgi:hypothetical protein